MAKKAVPMKDIYFLILFMGLVAFGINLFIYYSNLIMQCAYHPHISFFKTLGLQNYGIWLVAASVISFIILAIELYRDKVIDRVIWGLTLFFCIGGVAFLANTSLFTYYYDLYYGWTTIFLSLVIVGIITTFFAPAGFVGVVSDDKKAVRYASLKLLGISIVCFIWSVWAEWYGLSSFLYVALPVSLWRLMYDILGKKIRGEKISVFKW